MTVNLAVAQGRLSDSLAFSVPIFSAGMAFVAGPPLAAAVSNAGGIGFLGAGMAPPEGVKAMIEATRSMTSGPFGIDFVTDFFSTEHLDACVAARPDVVVFFWNYPQREWIDRLHGAGTQVWMQVGSLAEARTASGLGLDALIVQGAEAGGHNRASAGLISLLPAVVDAVAPLPIIAAGGIADGRGLAAALTLGAEAIWCGTRFLASEEAAAHPHYKRSVVDAGVDDTVRTTLFGPEWPDQPTRVFRNRLVREWAGREAEAKIFGQTRGPVGKTTLGSEEMPIPVFSSMLPTQETEGDLEDMGLTMGESAGLIGDILPAAVIVREMVDEARVILAGLRDPRRATEASLP